MSKHEQFEQCAICGKWHDIKEMIIVASRGRAARHYCFDCYKQTLKEGRETNEHY